MSARNKKRYSFDPEVGQFDKRSRQQKDVWLCFIGYLKNDDLEGVILDTTGFNVYVRQYDALSIANDHYRETGRVLSFSKRLVSPNKLIGLMTAGRVIRYTLPQKGWPPRGKDPYPNRSLMNLYKVDDIYVPLQLVKFIPMPHISEDGEESEVYTAVIDMQFPSKSEE